MPPRRPRSSAAPPLAALLAAALLAGCALPSRPTGTAQETADAASAQAPRAPAPVVDVRTAAEAAPSAPALAEAEAPAPGREPVLRLLDFADRVRTLAQPDLQAVIARILDTPEAQRPPLQDAKLAIALGQTRASADIARALAVLQRLQANGSDEARRLHPFARLLAARYNEQKRADDQGERLGQQLRDSQRRIDQLNERLEAMRAIERSLAPRPSSLLGRPSSVAAHAGGHPGTDARAVPAP